MLRALSTRASTETLATPGSHTTLAACEATRENARIVCERYLSSSPPPTTAESPFNSISAVMQRSVMRREDDGVATPRVAASESDTWVITIDAGWGVAGEGPLRTHAATARAN